VKHKAPKLVPLFICVGALALVSFLDVLTQRRPRFDLFQRLEWITYDWRVIAASSFGGPVASNLAFVPVSDDAISILGHGFLGTNWQYGLYWPRHVYGRVIRELSRQGARAIGLDVMFSHLRPDHSPVQWPGNRSIGSDQFFAHLLRQAGNVALGATPDAPPHRLFRLNAWALGDISTDRDADGALRRAHAMRRYRLWHPAIEFAARVARLDLARAGIQDGHIRVPNLDGSVQHLARIDADGYFDPTALTGAKPAAGFVRLEKAFEDVMVWHLGIVLAARELNLDLNDARVDLNDGRIVLSATNGLRRLLPVDKQGRFLIDWTIQPNDRRHLTQEAFETLLARDIEWEAGLTNAPSTLFRDKLVVVGSTATGNDLTDRGATPLTKDTFLTSNNWNVINSIITGRFITQSSGPEELGLICLLGLAAGLATWRLRPVWAALSVAVGGAIYTGVAFYAFIQWRHWLPLVFPVSAMLFAHFGLVTYRAVFEQNEQRRIKRIFAKTVSPNVVTELLQTEKLALGGARRNVTIFFADVRGFTELTDLHQAQAEEYVLQHHLSGKEAEQHIDEQAQQLLKTVNLYLSLAADIVKKHEGTLDKYIGDCVMAFWGAPTPNETHALACVHAAIEVQRAVAALNEERATENRRRAQENLRRIEQGQPPLPLLDLLHIGSGINTGAVTVGLMGSDAHLVNYTVFGREVNVASRLEGVSGRGRVIIGESTFLEIQRDDLQLAAQCIPLPPVAIKGIRAPVKIFEVPWAPAVPPVASASPDSQPGPEPAASSGATATTCS
jgi:class 3 adenylate cyclase